MSQAIEDHEKDIDHGENYAAAQDDVLEREAELASAVSADAFGVDEGGGEAEEAEDDADVAHDARCVARRGCSDASNELKRAQSRARKTRSLKPRVLGDRSDLAFVSWVRARGNVKNDEFEQPE